MLHSQLFSGEELLDSGESERKTPVERILRMYHDFFSRMATPKGEVSFTYLVGLVGLLEPWV